MHHIVVVDDSATNLRAHALLIEQLSGAVTHCFRSSSDALAWSADHEADCFIIDLRMPAPNGIALTRALRRHRATALTPIIMVTADREREARYAALDAGVNDFVEKPVDPREFLARIGTFLALQDARKRLASRVDDLTVSLDDEARRMRDFTLRLQALWKIAANPSIDDAEAMRDVLTLSAAAIRPGEPFVARLFRMQDDGPVLEASTESPSAPNASALPSARSPLETDLRIACERGAASAFDDDGEPGRLVVPFRAPGREYALVYHAPEPARRRFDSNDLLYVTIVAAFLQMRFLQRWQSDRIAYQATSDLLTGLPNRTRFRALARSAIEEHGRCAIAFVNLIDFSRINARYGNTIGDAVLVEAGTALAGIADGGEFVARLGGDTFGIGLPGDASETELRERLTAYLRVFESPFSTGDRDGREFVRLRARIGVAPADANGTLNALMSRAELAIESSRRLRRSNIAVHGADRRASTQVADHEAERGEEERDDEEIDQLR